MKNKVPTRFVTLMVFQLVFIEMCCSLKFLVLHPVYSGSHVLTVHHISQELVNRGHHMLTIRYKDTHDLKLEDDKEMKENYGVENKENNDELRGKFREYLLSLNNSDGTIPYVTKDEDAKFEIPSDLLWSEGTTLSTLFKLQDNPWNVLKGILFLKFVILLRDIICHLSFYLKDISLATFILAHCNHLLGNQSLLKELKEEGFDLAIVDLLYNPCSLSLASHFLQIPVVGYWAFSFVNGEADYTTVSTPPSYIPTFMTGFTDEMNFYQRLVNFSGKLFSHIVMSVHSYIMDSTIREHFPGMLFKILVLAIWKVILQFKKKYL